MVGVCWSVALTFSGLLLKCNYFDNQKTNVEITLSLQPLPLFPCARQFSSTLPNRLPVGLFDHRTVCARSILTCNIKLNITNRDFHIKFPLHSNSKLLLLGMYCTSFVTSVGVTCTTAAVLPSNTPTVASSEAMLELNSLQTLRLCRWMANGSMIQNTFFNSRSICTRLTAGK